jgi:hypothetical protein
VNIETDNITVYYESDQIVFAVPIDDDKVLESTLQIVKDGQENYTFNVISKKMIVTSELESRQQFECLEGSDHDGCYLNF